MLERGLSRDLQAPCPRAPAKCGAIDGSGWRGRGAAGILWAVGAVPERRPEMVNVSLAPVAQSLGAQTPATQEAARPADGGLRPALDLRR